MNRNRAELLAALLLPCVAWALHVEVPPMAMPDECFDVSFRYNVLYLFVR